MDRAELKQSAEVNFQIK
jgi:hypothetical protein